jgi:GAF domain-containing protein
MTTLPQDEVADLTRLVAELEQRLESSFVVYDQAIAQQTLVARENSRLHSELTTAREREAASADILRTISDASGDAEQSLQQIVEVTARLFGASSVRIRLAGTGSGRAFHVGRSSEAIVAAIPDARGQIGGRNLPGTVLAENRQIHVADLDHIDPDMADWPGLPVARAAGTRTISGTPLRRGGHAIGALIIHRDTLLPFTETELALQQSFADQAAIAVENARLFTETQEALERQTATADILKVIASSPSDVQPVFDAIAASAATLFGPCGATITTLKDGKLHWNATATSLPDFDFKRAKAVYPIPFDPARAPSARAMLERRIIEIPDVEAPDTPEFTRNAALAGGFKSITFVPLVNQDKGIGTIILNHPQPGFRLSKNQLALVQTFADQAVIAIENARLFNETEEALERQTTTADILKVIASSPSDVQPVFDAIAASANRLIGGFSTTVFRFIDDKMHLKAFTPTSPAADEMLQSMFPLALAGFPIFELVRDGETTQFTDTEAEIVPATLRDLARSRGFRSMLFTPLMNNGASIGMIGITRPEPGGFADRHIQLLQTFADQAVIAIENVRLFDEVQARTSDLSEALQQQTATADVLKVISRSAFDLQTVLETLTRSAVELSDAVRGAIFLRDGDLFRFRAASSDLYPEWIQFLREHPQKPGRKSAIGRSIASQQTICVPDVLADPEIEMPATSLAGIRAVLAVPLLRDGRVEGVMVLSRPAPGPFSARQIDLVQTFADQAVIAIENVRLFDEVQARTNDLSESLQQQTATADVLKVISRSVFNLQTVLDTLVESAYKLCGAQLGLLYLRGDEAFECKAIAGAGVAEADQLFKGRPIHAGRGTAAERVILTGEVHAVTDFDEDPELDPRVRDFLHRAAEAGSSAGQLRSSLAVPMTRDNTIVGVMVIARSTTGLFPARQVELLQTFADQAVIAIENARLFDEVQAKTADLSEALQQQTATADVLKVISRSTFDLQTVLETLIKSAVDLSGANRGSIFLREGDVFPLKAASSTTPEFLQYWAAHPPKAGRGSATERVIASGKVEIIPDVLEDPEIQMTSSSLVRIRAALGVPMLRDNKVEGVLVLTRPEPGLFTKSQIDLVQTFADQAVIAVENVRLFDETQARTKELAASLEELRAAQDRLVQTEKLASLGQLTAGIAHEIKNPLNFVNNFSSLSAELTDELNDVLKTADLADKVREEVDELTGLLKDNLQKVVQHGKRADSIVKNMLLHSREGSGDHRPTDINALLDESLNLAYHGARAEKPQFNVTLQRDFDPEAGLIEVFPQEITRVFLNLIGNGFYAVSKRKADAANEFEATVRASTRNLGDRVEIRIRDNGTGIPPEVKEKMFNPFFTTKPAGEGTGLGLSMTHDIIVKQHGGTIDVETEPGNFTEFTVVLPRASHFQTGNRGLT